MTLVDFPIPDVLKFKRRCRECHDPVEVLCAFGAVEPPPDPHFWCSDCRSPVPTATPARLSEIEADDTQLKIVES